MQNYLQLEPQLRRAWDGRIGALVAHREESGHWTVNALGAPHVGERPEKELIASFVGKIAALLPQRVTFNGSSFRSALSGHGPRGCRTGSCRASVFPPVYRGCGRSVRCAV